MTDTPAIDPAGFASLAELAGGDEAFIDDLVDTYVEDGDDQVARLRVAIAKGELTAVVMAAHSLRTSSANVGAARVAELAGALEADARTGSVADADARVDAIAEAFEAARSELLALRGRA